MVERLVRDQEVGCSNHLTPTRKITDGFAVCYFFARSVVLRQRHRESPRGRMLASRLTKTRAILGQKPRSGFCWGDENHLTPTILSLVNGRLQGFLLFLQFSHDHISDHRQKLRRFSLAENRRFLCLCITIIAPLSRESAPPASPRIPSPFPHIRIAQCAFRPFSAHTALPTDAR